MARKKAQSKRRSVARNALITGYLVAYAVVEAVQRGAWAWRQSRTVEARGQRVVEDPSVVLAHGHDRFFVGNVEMRLNECVNSPGGET